MQGPRHVPSLPLPLIVPALYTANNNNNIYR